MTDRPPRRPWDDFPDVILHASIAGVKSNECYRAAKSGDADAAIALVAATIDVRAVDLVADLASRQAPILVSAHAYESEGVNAIPQALAEELGRRLKWLTDPEVVQTNIVAHTGANGFWRLAHQPTFDGRILPGEHYVLVDDFVGQGGTLANLRGFIEVSGARVVGATALTGHHYSAKLSLDGVRLETLRLKHGKELESWWKKKWGYGFDCLTESEARYLERTQDAATIRSRIAEEEQKRDILASAEDAKEE